MENLNMFQFGQDEHQTYSNEDENSEAETDTPFLQEQFFQENQLNTYNKNSNNNESNRRIKNFSQNDFPPKFYKEFYLNVVKISNEKTIRSTQIGDKDINLKNDNFLGLRDLCIFFVSVIQDFRIAYRKICAVRSVRTEIMEISEQTTSSKSIGYLKPDFATNNFHANSNLDERHLIIADKYQFLFLNSYISIPYIFYQVYRIIQYEINLVSYCINIEIFCQAIFLVITIIANSPEIIIFILILQQRPVPDLLVLTSTVLNMLQRIMDAFLPYYNINQIYCQLLEGIAYCAVIWMLKIGKDMFWSVILYRINLILSIFLMTLATINSTGNFYFRLANFFICVVFQCIISFFFVLSGLVIDGEFERFLEGRSFLRKIEISSNLRRFLKRILSQTKQNIDQLQNLLLILAILLFLDSYFRLINSNFILLGQILLFLNPAMYFYGLASSTNFIDDLLRNVETCDNVVSDLIPIEVGKQLQKETIDSGVSFRSSESGRKKTTSELNLLPNNLTDILLLTQTCKNSDQNSSVSNYIRHHECVTVLSMDIVGFTSLSKKIGAINVMCMLNRLYYQLDLLSEKLGLYKIETIGDCYVVAGGIFNYEESVDNSHADRIIMMAAGIQNIANSMTAPGCPQEKLKVRIGIDSGPVTSGIIGKIRKRYCLFGKITNTANKLEQTCPHGKIQTSARTFSLLQSQLQRFGIVQQEGSYIFNWEEILEF